jgi:hypothetical protein
MHKTTLLAAAVLIASSAGASLAQKGASGTSAQRSPASIECSKQADAQGLKGKPRKKFKSKCKREFKG